MSRRGRIAGALVAGLLIGFMPSTALAHEKWLTEGTLPATDWSLVLSGRTALAFGVAALAVICFAIAQRVLGDSRWPHLPVFRRMARGDMRVLAMQAAIALIFLGVRMTLLAPQLALPHTALGYTLAAVEIGIAFTFITGVFDRAGAVALLALGPVLCVLFSPLDFIEQAQFAGIAVAIFIVGANGEVWKPRAPFDSPVWRARAMTGLRLFSGVAVLALALADKIWNPHLSMAFLTQYPYFNAARDLGLGISDQTFALAAGVVETVVAILLLSGYLTRVVILMMLVPFNLTVAFLGPEEIIGHLPFFGLMYLLLVHSGSRAEMEPREESSETPAIGEGSVEWVNHLPLLKPQPEETASQPAREGVAA